MYSMVIATSQHVSAIATIHHQCWTECYQFLPPEIHEARGPEFRKSQWQALLSEPSPDHFTIALLHGGQVVGFGHVKCNTDPDIPEAKAELHACYFLPAHRRQHIGPEMLLKLIRTSENRGWDTFCVWAWKQNPIGRTYGALGMQRRISRDRVIDKQAAPEIGYFCGQVDLLKAKLQRMATRLASRDAPPRNQRYSPNRRRLIGSHICTNRE